MLYHWLEKEQSLIVQEVVDRLQGWRQKGYVDIDVWEDVQPLLSFQLPPEGAPAAATQPQRPVIPSPASVKGNNTVTPEFHERNSIP